MKISLGAGVLFILVLAAVFVPRALEYSGPPSPAASLALRSTSPFIVEVVGVNVLKPLEEYRGELNLTGGGQQPRNIDLEPSLAAGEWPTPTDGVVTFEDRDGDGRLSLGDTFTIQPQSGFLSYRLLIFHSSASVDTRPPCPCTTARLVFP